MALKTFLLRTLNARMQTRFRRAARRTPWPLLSPRVLLWCLQVRFPVRFRYHRRDGAYMYIRVQQPRRRIYTDNDLTRTVGSRLHKEKQWKREREVASDALAESWRADANKQVLQVPRSLYLTYATIAVAFHTISATSTGTLTLSLAQHTGKSFL